MRVAAEGLRDDLLELGLNLVDILAGCEAGAVADAEDMRIDRKGFLAERCIQDNIRRLAPDAWKSLQLFPSTGDVAAVVVD